MDMCLIVCFMDVVEVECVGFVLCVLFVDKLFDEVIVVVIMIVEFLLLVVMMVKELVNCVYEMMLVEGVYFECWLFYLLFVIED